MTDRNTDNFVNKKLRGVKSRIMNILSRFVVDKVDDSKKMQELKGTLQADETKDELEHFQNFGFSSNAPKGSEGIAMSLNGNKDHTVVINADHRESRPKGLNPGESVVYNAFGDFIKVEDDGTIRIKCKKIIWDCETVEGNASGQTNFNSPNVKASALLTAQTNLIVTAEGTSVSAIKAAFNPHVHPENGGSGPTDGPDTNI